LVGFGTYKGTVIAAREWGERMERMDVPPAIEDSWDSIIHEHSNNSNRLILFIQTKTTKDQILAKEKANTRIRRGQRAIGVVYNPEYERYGNYVPSVLAERYDVFVHIDETHALHPLHMQEVKEDKEPPETFPIGL